MHWRPKNWVKTQEIVIDYLSPERSSSTDSNEGEKKAKIEDKNKGENCPSHIELGLKKPMSKYMLKDIPQLHKEIAELFSNLLGPLPLITTTSWSPS